MRARRSDGAAIHAVDEPMRPIERMLSVLGGVAMVTTAAITAGLGGGFGAGVFPPNEPVELRLVPIDSAASPSTAPAWPEDRLDVPPEFRTPDLSPPLWEVGSDGEWRLRQ